MVHTAEETAHHAETDQHNEPGFCLQQCRIWAGISPCYPDATTAWKHTHNRHPGDRDPPRGSAVYWTGGSQGFGHITISLGHGRVRSTDACGPGCVATRDLGWFESNWGLAYAGWAWDINEVTIPHGEDDMPLNDDDLERIAKRVNMVMGDYTAEGKRRDPQEDDPDQGNARLEQIEKTLRRVAEDVDRILKKLG